MNPPPPKNTKTAKFDMQVFGATTIKRTGISVLTNEKQRVNVHHIVLF